MLEGEGGSLLISRQYVMLGYHLVGEDRLIMVVSSNHMEDIEYYVGYHSGSTCLQPTYE